MIQLHVKQRFLKFIAKRKMQFCLAAIFQYMFYRREDRFGGFPKTLTVS